MAETAKERLAIDPATIRSIIDGLFSYLEQKVSAGHPFSLWIIEQVHKLIVGNLLEITNWINSYLAMTPRDRMVLRSGAPAEKAEVYERALKSVLNRP